MAKAGPSSTTSGARDVPFSDTIAWFSWAELSPWDAVGLFTFSPYFFWKVLMISP